MQAISPSGPSSPHEPRPGRTAWILGLAGLIPFVGLASVQALSPPGWRMLAASALLTYGAVIVSFLGGIHWGLAMRESRVSAGLLFWGIIASLLGWLAVLLEGLWGQGVLALSLILCLWVDQKVYGRLGLQGWLPLRRLLTLVATLSVLAGAACYWWL